MSLEVLLQSKFGARTCAQVDVLLAVMRDVKAEQEPSFQVVKILRATIKEEPLTYFIDQRGLTVIHAWLKEWTKLPSSHDKSVSTPAPSPSPTAEEADKCVETLRMLLQLPVTVHQLKQNAELCRFLRHLSKSSREDRVVALAKDVVDLWKEEVRAGAELFLPRIESQREGGKKRPVSDSATQERTESSVPEKGSSQLPLPQDSAGGNITTTKSICVKF